MKYSKEFKRYIFNLIGVCKALTYTGEYQIDVFFSDNECDNPFDDNRRVAAEISVDDAYLNATITIYPAIFEYWEDKEYKEIGKHILHELCHIVTEPLKGYPIRLGLLSPLQMDELRFINERQTQRIRNCILQQVQANWSDPVNVAKMYKELCR